jgi:hypothetical protein
MRIAPMSYRLFAALCAFAIAILRGVADSMQLVTLLLLAAPLFLMGLGAQLFRSMFTQSVAVNIRQVIAGLAALALIYTWLSTATDY